MDDVTDVVFRQIVAEEGKPDVFFTEFVNVDALCSAGREAQSRRLLYTEDQRPIVIQIWGKEPEHFRKVATELVAMGFDGIDVNMGCPDRTVLKNGLCSALIEDHARAAEIIAAVKEGREGSFIHPSPAAAGTCLPAGREGRGERVPLPEPSPPTPPPLRKGRGGKIPASLLPVSVKTRIGIKKPVTEDWIGFLLEQGLDAITIHARTVKDMSKAPARWGEIAKAVKLRDSMGKGTVIIGNGDVTSRAQALAYAEEYGVDGVMIGRGIFQNLWLFHPEKCDRQIPLTEKLRVLRRHVELYRDMWGETRSFEILKKFIKVYISGFPGAAEMRKEFMSTQSYAELLELTHSSMATGIPTN